MSASAPDAKSYAGLATVGWARSAARRLCGGGCRRLRAPSVAVVQTGAPASGPALGLVLEEEHSTSASASSVPRSAESRPRESDSAAPAQQHSAPNAVAPQRTDAERSMDTRSDEKRDLAEIARLDDWSHINASSATIVSFSAAISMCSRATQWLQALGLLRDMPLNRVMPNAVSFHATIDACSRGSAWPIALELLRSMPQFGIRPGANAFTSGIAACKAACAWQEALRLLGDMRSHGMRPDLSQLNAVMRTCEKSRAWRQALQLLEIICGDAAESD
mmetsp:Transcript_115626/g.326886  ORF Transcript_115626/g.326886 Transcript_115626/m.326886 type:complete len:277 (+) Transcript_115626:85-915(+)